MTKRDYLKTDTYAVGDRVKVTPKAFITGRLGQVGEVVKVVPDYAEGARVMVRFADGHESTFCFAASLERASHENLLPGIKVGDRVRARKYYKGDNEGVGTVVKVDHVNGKVGVEFAFEQATYNESVRSLTIVGTSFTDPLNNQELIKSYAKAFGAATAFKKPSDPINHPEHYTAGGIEVLDAVEAWGIDKHAYLKDVIKYVARHERKGKPLEDLEKAAFYLQRHIERAKKTGLYDE